MNDRIIYGLSGPDGRLSYIGSSRNDLTYVVQHHRSAAKARKNQSPVNLWILEVGLHSFTGEVLETVTEEDAADRLQWWLDAAREAGHPIRNLTKEDHSERVRKAMNDPEVRARIEASRPRKYTRRADWVSRKGQTGRHISEEHKAAVSRAHKGKVLSEETRRKIAEKAKGHKRNAGRVQSEETRLKMSWTKHQNGHVAKEIVREGCRWCAGDTLSVN